MLIKNKLYSNEELKKFWVGLMDGVGSIQVNHWRNKVLQYRFVIKLKNTNANFKMLNDLSAAVKGFVRVSSDKSWVLWIVNNKNKIISLLEIFNLYPPITSRLRSQVLFMKKCMELNQVSWYLSNRVLKYDITFQDVEDMTKRDYFPIWLAGFVEAEGCFSRRKTNVGSFSIGQKNDMFILNMIQVYFSIPNNVRKLPNNFFLLEVYKKENLLIIEKHFQQYPLLGQKYISFLSFYKLPLK